MWTDASTPVLAATQVRHHGWEQDIEHASRLPDDNDGTPQKAEGTVKRGHYSGCRDRYPNISMTDYSMISMTELTSPYSLVSTLGLSLS